MGTIISTSTSSGITLSSTSSNPVTVTGTGIINVASGPAIYGQSGGGANIWTITNSGTMKSGNDFALELGESGHTIVNSVITNLSGGYIDGASGPGYGVAVFGSGTLVNQSGGTIKGKAGGAGFLGNATITNSGIIIGNSNGGGSGVYLLSGSVTNAANATISGETGVYVKSNGAATITNFGTITGVSASTAGAVRFSGTNSADRVIDNPGATFTGGGLYGGTGVLELASASSAQTLNPVHISNFSTVVFDSANWLLGGLYGDLKPSTISGFVQGDTIDLTNFRATGSSFASGVLTLTNASTSTSLTFQGSFTQSQFSVTNDTGSGSDITLLCFCHGTYIAMPDGDVPVERLSVGNQVLTLSGQIRAIKWIGTGRHILRRGERCSATPVVIRRGAFADNVPNRDLRVTKGHSFLLDGALIPIEFLVNHRSIQWDDTARAVEVFHLELDTHDVLLANGAPAESYRDDGNRRLFHNRNQGWDATPQPSCAPVLTGGPVVDGVWRRLLDRSGPQRPLPLTDDADLHLVVDGCRLDAASRYGSAYVFTLPGQRRDVRIASRAASPQELGLSRDPRCLGVALRQVIVQQGGKFAAIEADDTRLSEGFHEFEPAEGFRWTSGDAIIPVELLGTLSEPAMLIVNIACTTQYLDEGERYSAA